MNEVLRYFTKRIQTLVNHYGIVVWYDPDKLYRKLVEKLQFNDIPIVQFQGSFLAVRHKIEPYLAQNERPRLLIYVPMDRRRTNYALIEAEAAGCYLMPGHPSLEFNTSLESVTIHLLKDIVPGNLEEILQKVQQKEFTIEDIDRIASSGYGRTTGALKLIYDHADPVEIIVRFMAEPQKDDELRQKNAIQDVRLLVQDQFGIQLTSVENTENLRTLLWRVVLINDFLTAVQMTDNVPEQLSQIPRVDSNAAQEAVAKVAQTLREKSSYQDVYQQWASRVESDYAIQNINIPPKALLKAETFAVLEQKLLQYALQQYLKTPDTQMEEWIDRRRLSFWGKLPPYNIVWDWLKQGVELWKIGKTILTDLNKYKLSAEQLIRKYTDEENGWYRLDQWYHEFEMNYQQLEPDAFGEAELLEKVWVNGRRWYSRVLRELTERFQNAFIQSEAIENVFPLQREIFNQYLAPALKDGKKIAYVVADALRYEMGVKLKQLLQKKADVQLRYALGQLPGITVVGMGALLPEAEKFMALTTSKKGQLGIDVNGTFLSNRKERIQYLKKSLPDISFDDVWLDKIRQPKKSVKDKIEKAQFLLVSSQEIDQIGETINPGIARKIMDGLLTDLRNAIYTLLQLGVETIIVTSDHGYLFGEELDPGDKVDAPGGQTVELHRRVWIGRGGKKHPSYIRLTESQVGLSGELELVFPKGIAGFKCQGGNEVYFHGGISLQEMVIPVLEIHSREVPPSDGVRIDVTMSRHEITNRLFVVRVTYQPDKLFPPDTVRANILVLAGKDSVGRVTAAEYGFDASTGEVILEKHRANAITLAFTKEPPPPVVDIIVQDAETGAVLAKISDIPVKLTI